VCRPQQVDLWVRLLHVCVGMAACPWTSDFRPCAPQAKIYRFVPFYLFFFKKKKRLLYGKFWDFLTIWWKAPFWLVEKQKKDGYFGDPARGQADPGSAAVYTMDCTGPVICTSMYVCVGTVSHALGPTDPLVVALDYEPNFWGKVDTLSQNPSQSGPKCQGGGGITMAHWARSTPQSAPRRPQ
jgi:hypothetical protein